MRNTLTAQHQANLENARLYLLSSYPYPQNKLFTAGGFAPAGIHINKH